MAETIRKENEQKKIKVKAPVTAKKNKQHQTSNCDISVRGCERSIPNMSAKYWTFDEKSNVILISNLVKKEIF